MQLPIRFACECTHGKEKIKVCAPVGPRESDKPYRLRHPVGRAAAHVGRHVGCRTVKSRLPSNRLLNGPLDVISAIFLFQYLFLQFFNKILLFGKKNPYNSDTPAIRALADCQCCGSSGFYQSPPNATNTAGSQAFFAVNFPSAPTVFCFFFHKDVCIVSPPIKGCVKIRPASTPMTGLYKVKLCESKIVLDGQ